MTNKKLMRRWIEVLRSRPYKQGQGWLRQVKDGVEKHCCLGVACELFGNKKSWKFNEDIEVYSYNENDMFLTKSIADKLGLSANEQKALANMNDEGKKFYQIARYLERKYLRD